MNRSNFGLLATGAAVIYVLYLGIKIVLPTFGIGGDQRESWAVDFDIHPSGQGIVFSSAKGDIYTFDLKSQKVTNLISTVEEESSPHYSPDGKWIIFCRQVGSSQVNKICRMSLKDGRVDDLTKGLGTSDDYAAISPDGKTVCFFRASNHRQYGVDYDLCSIPFAGGAVTELTHNKYRAGTTINILPDSQGVIYTAESKDSSAVQVAYRLDLATPNATPVALDKVQPSNGSLGAWESNVALSRDGKHIAFISDRERSFYYDVWVADASGKNAVPRHVTSVGMFNTRPVFEPNSLDILFLAGTETNGHARAIYSLYRSGADGKLTEIAGVDLFQKPETYGAH